MCEFWPTWGDGLTWRNALDRCAICEVRRLWHPWFSHPRGWPFREPVDAMGHR